MPWTSLYLTSLELEGFGEIVAIAFCIPFIAVQMVFSKTNDFSRMEVREHHNADEVTNNHPIEVQCPENVVRKEEELMDLDLVINEIQNKFYF